MTHYYLVTQCDTTNKLNDYPIHKNTYFKRIGSGSFQRSQTLLQPKMGKEQKDL